MITFFYKAAPAFNAALTLSAAVLSIYLFMHVRETYHPGAPRNVLSQAEIPKLKQEQPLFDDGVFSEKRLFTGYSKKTSAVEKENFILRGVSIGEKNLAVIKDVLNNKEYYCREGDSIGAFSVKRILKEQVILESERETIILSQ
jgi:hypothetical protein